MKFTPKADVRTDELVDLYAAGHSLEQIAKRVPLTSGAIRYRLLRVGVTLRPKNQGITPSDKHPISTAELVARYATGQSANVIGHEVGLSPKAVLDRLARANVQRRTRSDYPGAFGEGNPNWRGGQFTRDDGYVLVRHEGRYVFQHRLIAAHSLGRPLTRSEHVHHFNGIRDDNRPANLAVLDARAHKREGWTLVKVFQRRIRELEEQLSRVLHSEKSLDLPSGTIPA